MSSQDLKILIGGAKDIRTKVLSMSFSASRPLSLALCTVATLVHLLLQRYGGLFDNETLAHLVGIAVIFLVLDLTCRHRTFPTKL
ncbi:hypothetical protein F5144DRAFT_583391 [Chaetomium tenue]|uniref:Uncharacterized protein n=1 Tax=Chaetomium tenue TaxID=1854479 RepID=A0ACB7P3A1_9PEZI|nr:hypothetical protein F5144DRAFT_583391 [Chaetomium globosum]